MKTDYEKSVSKADLDHHLKRIANILVLNGSFTDNLGLLSGKIGISIFFFHYFKYTNKKIYSEYAGELIDEIYEEITTKTPVNFENGLTGIGWGIEYLVKNGFVQAETDEALNDIDEVISKKLLSAILTSESFNDLAGYGFYFLSRLGMRESGAENHVSDRIMQNIKYFTNYLMRIFVSKEFHDFDFRSLTAEIISSLLWFLLETNRIIPDSGQIAKVLKGISEHVEYSLLNQSNGAMNQRLKYLAEDIKTSFPDNQLQTSYRLILENEKNLLSSLNEADNSLAINCFIKNEWQNLVYAKNMGEKYKIEEINSIITKEEYWKQQLENLKPNGLGLNGLSGLGLGILRFVNRTKIVQ